VSSYKYVPDSRSQQLYEQIFAGWDQFAEKKYLDNLILETDNNSSSVLFLDNDRLTQITPDSAVYQADYILVFQHRRASLPKSAKGNLNITIATDNNELFYIKQWEDYSQNDTDFTWSELKANFSN
jgi:hypothetical protein